LVPVRNDVDRYQIRIVAQILNDASGAVEAQASVDITIHRPSPIPRVTITRAQQQRLECVRLVAGVPCLPVVYASRVSDVNGVPRYQVELMSLAGSAVDGNNSPIPANMLT